MKVLAFDTCFSACSAAVGHAGDTGARAAIVASEYTNLDAGHAEALVPMIQRVMAEAGWKFAELDRIVVTRGPGTFTGVRTGIAVARGLGLSTPARLVGVSSLWAIGDAACRHLHNFEVGFLVVMDARKGMVYAQAVDRGGNETTEPQLVDRTIAARHASEAGLTLVGTGLQAVAEAAADEGLQVNIPSEAASDLTLHLPQAAKLIAAGHREPCQGPLQPLYLRPPDAKPQSGKALPWSPS